MMGTIIVALFVLLTFVAEAMGFKMLTGSTITI
jgi:hypothetical protein